MDRFTPIWLHYTVKPNQQSRNVLESLALLDGALFSSLILFICSFFAKHLAGMEKTMQDYEDWTTEPIPDSLDRAYKKASSKLEKCLPFEDSLVSIDLP